MERFFGFHFSSAYSKGIKWVDSNFSFYDYDNYPDNSFAYNEYKVADNTWENMENAGVVFLPAAGYRYGKDEVDHIGSFSYYWSDTPCGADGAYYLTFNLHVLAPLHNDNRSYGLSVRLVTDIK